MDGIKRRIGRSIRARLSAWISLVVVIISLISGVLSFTVSFYEAHELQDDQLRQFGALIKRQGITLQGASLDLAVNNIDHEARIYLRDLSHPLSDNEEFAHNMPDSFSTISEQHKSWRVYVVETANGQRIALTQDTALRNEIARDSALRALFPLLFLVPILVTLINFIIARMFLPVSRLAEELNRPSSDERCRIDEDSVPDEIQPFVVSINRLLSNLYESVEKQKRFIANAAHELRTPITALCLQAETLDAEERSDREMKFTRLRAGLNRTKILLEQLLAHARSQDEPKLPLEICSVQQYTQEVIADLIPHVQRKQIDIGMPYIEDTNVRMIPIDLYTVVKNIVDNAIRYTPLGGQVDVSLRRRFEFCEICVLDSGPGIPEHELVRVKEPFFRGSENLEQGSGLGLAIVSQILSRAGGKMVLSNSVDGGRHHGLKVQIFIPLA